MKKLLQNLEKYLNYQWVGKTTIFLTCILGILLRMYIVLSPGVLPFNSDEAIVALMARHILSGERPIFFYGQAYMGSFDAYLTALGFLILGQHVLVIRLIQIGMTILTIWTTGKIASKIFSSKTAGWLAAIMMIFPPVNTLLYTTVSLGGYGEALLLGNLIILCAMRIATLINESPKHTRTTWMVLLLGFLCGFGFWVFGLTLVYSISALALVSYKIYTARKSGNSIPVYAYLGAILGGMVVGIMPIWFYASKNGFTTLLRELSGSAVAVNQSGWFHMILDHIRNLLLLGGSVVVGLRPPWGVIWLGLPLIPVVLILWGAIIWHNFHNNGKGNRQGIWAVYGTGIILTAAFILSAFGNDPSGRYFLPIYFLLTILAGKALSDWSQKSRIVGVVLTGILICFQVWGAVQSMRTIPPGLTTQFDPVAQVDHQYLPDLMRFLNNQDIKTGYSNYWVAYPLAFISQEQLIFVPLLPYHQDLRYTRRDDRYPIYDQVVAQSQKNAYITTFNPNLDQKIVEGFIKKDIRWNEVMIGDYHVYYNLSMNVSPEEIGLGMTTP